MEEPSASVLGTPLTPLTTSPSICHPELRFPSSCSWYPRSLQTPGEAGVSPGTQEMCAVEEEETATWGRRESSVLREGRPVYFSNRL